MTAGPIDIGHDDGPWDDIVETQYTMERAGEGFHPTPTAPADAPDFGPGPRGDLDRAMRAVLAQLETCSHVSAGPWGPTGRSPASDEPQGGKRPPGDIGHTIYARDYGPPFHRPTERYPGAADDEQRARIIDLARAELRHLRGQVQVDRPEPESLEHLRDRIIREGDGWTVEQVALAMRCGERVVIEARKAAGRDPEFGGKIEQVEVRRGRPRRDDDGSATQRRRIRLHDLIRRGHTLANAARVLGVSTSTAERDLGRR